MSSGSVKKWVRKQIDKATENEKSKLAKVKELLKELEVITDGNNADPEAAVSAAHVHIKLALAWLGE